MNIEEYPDNSNQSKEKVVVPATTGGSARLRKKNGAQKIAGQFLSDDADNIGSYIVGEILLPTLKKTISDVVTNGIDILLYGESGKSVNKRSSSTSRINYRSYYDEPRRVPEKRTYRTYEFDDVEFDSRGEAEEKLDMLEDIIDEYGFARVSDLYDLAKIDCDHTSTKYGWTDLRTAKVIRLSNGAYMIKLPRALPID